MKKLFQEFRGVFPASKAALSRTTVYYHKIDTPNHPPFRQNLRRSSIVHREEISKQIKEMLGLYIIGVCHDVEWASNIVLAD